MKKTKTNKQLIVSALRAAWMRSPGRREALKEAKHPSKSGWFICQECGGEREKVTVDHTTAIGVLQEDLSNLTEYGRRMFFGKQRAIDKDCHGIKTKKENALRREQKKVQKIHELLGPTFCQHDDPSWCTDKCPKRKK